MSGESKFVLIETERLKLCTMKSEDITLVRRIFSDQKVLKAFNLKSLSEKQMNGRSMVMACML
jgi:hypothetical protein